MSLKKIVDFFAESRKTTIEFRDLCVSSDTHCHTSKQVDPVIIQKLNVALAKMDEAMFLGFLEQFYTLWARAAFHGDSSAADQVKEILGKNFGLVEDGAVNYKLLRGTKNSTLLLNYRHKLPTGCTERDLFTIFGPTEMVENYAAILQRILPREIKVESYDPASGVTSTRK
jgi:hypothetical protein